jgi:nicotinate-nucleotide adenylyltransferase
LIGIFGGSFDPPHLGHENIIYSFHKYFPESKELIIVPNHHSPFKDSKNVSKTHILNMLNIILKKYKNTKTIISHYEIDSDAPSYTINTLEYFISLYPNETFQLILGADNLQNFPKWKFYKKILELSKLIIFQRPGFKVDIPIELKEYSNSIEILENTMIDYSSTNFRKIKNHNYLSPEIIEYIKQNGLYGH